MGMTRAQAEAELVIRCGNWLEACRPNAADPAAWVTAVTGSSLAASLRAWSVHPADPGSPTDDELARIGPDDDERFYLSAELRTLLTIRGNYFRPDQSNNNQSQHLGSLLRPFRDHIRDVREELKNKGGEPATGLAVVRFRGDYQQPGCRTEWEWGS